MLESLFNVHVKVSDAETLIANCLTRAVVSIDKEPNSEDESVLSELGILVHCHDNERCALRTALNYARFDKSSARLVICPTMRCNFRCTYCFQEHRASADMTKDVQNSLIRHVESLIDEGIREICVTWFGGEPLLRWDLISSLTQDMRSLCIDHGVGYSSAIITNGYLLSADIVRQMLELDPQGWTIQVTIDGDQKHHDDRRRLMSGEGTFSVIASNLSSIRMDEIKVAVRVNIDKCNIGEFEKVKEQFEFQQNVYCYATPITIEKTQNTAQVSACYSHCEHGTMWRKLADTDAKSFSVSALLDGQLSVCSAEHFYSAVIDPAGYMYKCLDEAGRSEHAYANLLDPDLSRPEWQVKYTGRDVFGENECSDCPCLPLCHGGCFAQFETQGTHKCAPVKFLLEDALVKEYGQT